MSTYRTVRGKTVRLGRITLDVAQDGYLSVIVLGVNGEDDAAIGLAEPLASDVYNLLGDVMEWESQKGSTEAAMDRLGDVIAAKSGELDDVNAASNK